MCIEHGQYWTCTRTRVFDAIHQQRETLAENLEVTVIDLSWGALRPISGPEQALEQVH